MSPPNLRTLLLFPSHLSPNPTTLPFLTALQSLLNVSYTATYCSRPDIFGTSHLRLADPTTFAEDIIGADGFTVVVLAVESDQRHQHRAEYSDGNDDSIDAENDNERLAEVVATASVKVVDDEDVRRRAQRHRAGRATIGDRDDSSEDSFSIKSDGLNDRLQALYRERQHLHRVYELQALAVSPKYQDLGLGARVLRNIEWLLGRDGNGVLDFAREVDESSALFMEARLVSSSSQSGVGGRVYGIDMDELKNVFDQIRYPDMPAGSEAKQLETGDANGVDMPSSSPLGQRKIVLVAIREIGNEDYYLRRGYESIGTGVLPLGTWGSEAECTAVFMEKSI